MLTFGTRQLGACWYVSWEDQERRGQVHLLGRPHKEHRGSQPVLGCAPTSLTHQSPDTWAVGRAGEQKPTHCEADGPKTCPGDKLSKGLCLPRPVGLEDSAFPGRSDIRLLAGLWREKNKIEKSLSHTHFCKHFRKKEKAMCSNTRLSLQVLDVALFFST